ncbi:scaffold/adaptor protein [Lithospermum erythrorhizon]|uniref:Scaffold/adaptor protein n=1 Tax=Lithospermum erythrorhizon TaxID=34254 RepID=A0AAV3QDR4_LITER
MEPIEINCPEAKLENKVEVYKVCANDSGKGLPYAPVDWPNPGDKWRWKVGRRVENNGFFRDRYLYPPTHLPKSNRKTRRFDSKLSVEQYFRSISPGADVNAFLDSFSWKIPSKQLSYNLGYKAAKLCRANVVCKAANKTCCSLVEAEDTHQKFMSCSICCTEHGFCRYCCCILLCKGNTFKLNL